MSSAQRDKIKEEKEYLKRLKTDYKNMDYEMSDAPEFVSPYQKSNTIENLKKKGFFISSNDRTKKQ